MNVDFITAIKMFFANYANFKGRSTRAEYWWVMLFMFLVSCVLSMFGTLGNYINYAFSLACLIPGLALGTRRLHDTGKSGWWIAIFYIAMTACLIWIVTILVKNAPELLNNDPTAAARMGDEILPVLASVAIPYMVMLALGIWWIVLMCKKSEPDNQYGPNPYGEY
ncbi:MAG: DUF805 domain-containing protein [Muribaculaceae bacterium]|nr:DUF805 domain-containing protein [Muribaculaceae bacterium]